MIVLSAVVKAKKGKERELEDALRAMIPAAQQEEGVVEYVLHQAQNDRSKFFFYEKYRDKAAYEYHINTPYVKALFSKLPALLDGEAEVELYEDIAAVSR